MNTLDDKSNPILSLRALKMYYPASEGVFLHAKGQSQAFVKAVDGVDLDIFPGETLGLVGESGCGKSTLGRMMVRLEHPTSGEVLFEGENITDYNEHKLKNIRSQLQFIFQDPYSSLNPKRRVVDILSEPILTHKILPAKSVPERVDELLSIVGLSGDYRNRFPHELSGGQRQRIGIARALSMNPKLIVCDEPVSALDVSIQAQILNLLAELQQKYQLSYLFIAHGLGAVRYISDRIAIMYLGKMIEVADAEEIFRNPIHPYTRALLDAYPVPNPHLRGEKRMIISGEPPSPANPPSGCRFHTRCPFADAECSLREPTLTGDAHQVACLKADTLKSGRRSNC